MFAESVKKMIRNGDFYHTERHEDTCKEKPRPKDGDEPTKKKKKNKKVEKSRKKKK